MNQRLLGMLLLLLAGQVSAATYGFGNGWFVSSNYPPCSGSWSQSGSTYTCTGRVSLASGDILRVNTGWGTSPSDITVYALAGFSLNNNSIGNSDYRISLRSDYGSVDAIGSNTIQGSVLSASRAFR